MPIGIFSTYRNFENRVTASFLAVLRSLSNNRMQRIVGAMLGESSLELVEFKNQPAHGGTSLGVADAEITGRFRILIETKIGRGGADEEQLDRHLARLENDATGKVIVLTPDASIPPIVSRLSANGGAGEGKLVWVSFGDVSAAFDEMIADPSEVVGEREAFLIREFQAMLEAEGLLEQPNNVVVVAASLAWPIYEEHGVYVCQANRTFRPVPYFAFYADGEIKPLIPRIIPPPAANAYDAVMFRDAIDSGEDRWLSEKCQELVTGKYKYPRDSVHKIIRLSGPNDKMTNRLEHPVRNDITAESGRRVAFTQSQRYVRLELLKDAATTSELVKSS